MLGRLKSHARAFIGRYRTSAPIAGLHAVAAFVESAYENEGSEFDRNGERAVINHLARANFRTVLDVGANHGDWLVEALQAWPNSHVHAFEVAPVTFQRLGERVDGLKTSGRVTLNNLGLSDVAGAEQMYFFPAHPELTCDRVRHEGMEVEPFQARLERGDDYLARQGITEVDFLKIDVEGAEHRVLKGFPRALAQGRVHCMQLEYGAFGTQTRILLADYYALLSKDFWIGKIYPTYVDFRDYHWKMEDFRFSNYCGVSRARPDLKKMLER